MAELERLERYASNKKLFEAKHDQVYKHWIKLLRRDKQATLEIILNWPKRLSKLWADLLVGEPPEITAGEPDGKEQKYLEKLIENNNLISVIYQVVIDCSRFGTGLFKLRFDGRNILVEGIPPDIWFPVVNPANIKEITHHVFAWTQVIDETISAGAIKKQIHLFVEIHEPGKITSLVFEMKDGIGGGRIGRLVQEAKVQTVPIQDFLVIPFHNDLTTDRLYGMDDYVDLDPVVQELEVRFSQISKILDKHSDPNMAGPASALEEDVETGEVTVRGGGSFYPMEPGDNPPQYITWDGELESNFQYIDKLMEQFYAISETSPAAFGQLKAGLAESGSALRRLMLAPLAKVARLRMHLDPVVKLLLWITSQFDMAVEGQEVVILENIEIEWKDGLPADFTEDATNESTLYMAGLTSLESSLKRLFGLKGKALQDELERIKAEKQAVAVEKPSIQLPSSESNLFSQLAGGQQNQGGEV